MATPAPALVVLRDEVNAEHPGRDKSSDGWLGDLRHNASGAPENGGSRHNPNRRGVVDARDIDNSAIDVARLVACAMKHPSVRNIIYNRKIRSKGYGGLSRVYSYNGVNPHDKHVHVDLELTTAAENDLRPWGYHRGGTTTPVVHIAARPAAGTTSKGGMTKLPVLRRNPAVALAATRTLQRALAKLGHPVGSAGADGRFGNDTFTAVRTFQRKHGLTADGVVGPKTWVALAQALLARAGQNPGKVDADFGPKTSAATVAFQKAKNLTADGIVGPRTWAALLTV